MITQKKTTTTGMLRSIRAYPRYRFLVGNSFLVQLCFSVQNTLVAFSILQHTNSFFLVGVTMAANFAPNIFGLFSGAVVDKWSRRKLIAVINGFQIIPTLSLAFALSQPHVEFWVVVSIVFANSSIIAIIFPAQYALIGDIVEAKDITNATSFLMAFQYVAGLAGSALVGILANIVGISNLLFLDSGFVAIALTLIVLMGEPAMGTRIQTKLSIISNIKEGLKYSWVNKVILGGEMVYFVTNLYMWPCVWTLIPIFSRSVLGLGASGLGWLNTAYNFGSLAGNLTLASRNSSNKGMILFGTSIGWGISFILLASWAVFPFSLIALFMMGAVSSLVMTLASVILLSNASQEIRGRVMGIQTLFIASQGGGSLIAGLFAQSFGAIGALDAESILFIGTMILLMLVVPALRKAK